MTEPSKTLYQHTQYARWTWAPIIIGAILCLLSSVYSKAGATSIAMVLGCFFLMAVLALFIYALTVSINADGTRLSAKYGIGLYTKNVVLSDVVSYQKVRNSFWMGWGIRWIPGGWLYNIDGLDAIELTLKNASKVRIGTDEPDKLLEALNKTLN